MSIEDLAAKAVEKISKSTGKNLKKKRTAPPIFPHTIKQIENLDGKYEVGFSSCEIMPEDVLAKKYWIAGHGMGRRIEGVHDPLTANAMWLGCGKKGGIVFCSIDTIGLTNTEIQIIRERLVPFCKQTNCLSINISCTHTHAGFDTVGYWGKLPKTGKDPEYMALVFTRVVSIIKAAYEKRTPGDLYVGSIHCPEGQLDRREPIVLHDDLTRLRFVPDNGSKETWFLNFAAHPNTLGGKNRLVSADYPYFMRETIRKEQDVNILFSIGAIGAVDPGPFCDDCQERTELQGEYLGRQALKIDNDEKLECKLLDIRQPFYNPADNAVLTFLAKLHVMSAPMYPDDISGLGLALKTEMTYIEIGKQKLLLLPGECFPETIYGGYDDAEHSSTGKGPEINPTPLAEIAKDDKLLVFGITNDMAGYVVPPNDFVLHPTQAYLSTARDRFDRRHYHETNSLGIHSQEAIANTFAKIMKRVEEQRN